MNQPTISVVVPSYNHAKYLPELIESVLTQTWSDWELCLVDDGSTDHSVEIIKSYTDPRIRLHVFKKNMGAVDAQNFAIKMARGRYIASLNSDDAMLPEKLETQIRFLEENPQFGAVFAKPLLIDQDGDEQNVCHLSEIFKTKPERNWGYHLFKNGNAFCHSSILVRRECFDKCGLFNPVYHQLPDYDMWVRVAKEYPIHVLEQPLVKYRIHTDGDSVSSPCRAVNMRTRWENVKVLNNFLSLSEGKYHEFFGNGTPVLDNRLIPFMVAKEALSIKTCIPEVYAHFALDAIHHFMIDPNQRYLLEKYCGYTMKDFTEDKGKYWIFGNKNEDCICTDHRHIIFEAFLGKYCIRLLKK